MRGKIYAHSHYRILCFTLPGMRLPGSLQPLPFRPGRGALLLAGVFLRYPFTGDRKAEGKLLLAAAQLHHVR